MTEIFELITKLRQELENCRTGDNDSKVMDAVQTLNAIDNKLLKQANGIEQSYSNCIIPDVSGSLPLNKDAAIKMLTAFMKDTVEMLNGKRFAPSLKPEHWFDEYTQREQ